MNDNLEYAKLLSDPRWLTKRSAILELRGRKCVDCGSTDGEMHVHHAYYRRGRNPWDYPDDAFHVMCSRCHFDLHNPMEYEPTAQIVTLLAERMTIPVPAKDKRAEWWIEAKATAADLPAANHLMSIAGWLDKNGYGDIGIVREVFRLVSAKGPVSAHAYFRPGGKALESIVGLVAERRAELERQANNAADKSFLRSR